MKKMLALLMALVMVLGMVPTAWATTGGNTIYVAANGSDDYQVNSDTQPYATLQKAVDEAVDGDTITISAGTYAKPVVIDNKDLTIIGQEGTVITFTDAEQIQQTSKISGDTTTISRSYYAGIVTVSNATVSFENITIKGNAEAASVTKLMSTCVYTGLLSLNADVTMTDCAIRDTVYVDGKKGTQNGDGIYAAADSAKTLTLKNTAISNFDKIGIVVCANVSLNITGGSITGFGPTDVTAQNGIQFEGATANIDGLSISDIYYTGSEWVAVGFMNFGDTVTVENLNVTNTYMGISSGTTSSTMTIKNIITSGVVYSLSGYNGMIKVEGGSYEGWVWAAAPTNIIVSGGEYTKKPSTNYVTIADGCIVDWNGHGYAVGDYTAFVFTDNDTDYYATLTAAVAAAQPGNTIKVVDDTPEQITLPIGVYYYPNGKTVPMPLAPTGYKLVSDADGFYTPERYAVQNGDKYYDSLTTAVKEAKSGDTIVLWKNNTEDAVTLKEGVKLDTNGFKLTNDPTAPAGFVAANVDGVWNVTKLPEKPTTPTEPDTSKGSVDMAATIPNVTVSEKITETEQQEVAADLVKKETTAEVSEHVLADGEVAERIEQIHTENKTAEIIAVPVIDKKITDVKVEQVGEVTMPTQVEYEVTGKLILKVNGKQEETTYDLGKTNRRITFQLPVPTAWNGKTVYVVHESSYGMDYHRPVAQNGLIEITSWKGLSPFQLSIEKPENFPSYGGGGGGSYVSGHLVTSTLKGIEKVYVDGVLVDSKNYTVSGGDVTLKQSFMDSLKAGTHTVKLIYGDRQATGTFTTKGTGKVESAKTFDAGIALYAGMALSSALGAAYVMGKKKEN